MPKMIPPKGAKGLWYAMKRIEPDEPVEVAENDVAALEAEGWLFADKVLPVNSSPIIDNDIDDEDEVM